MMWYWARLGTSSRQDQSASMAREYITCVFLLMYNVLGIASAFWICWICNLYKQTLHKVVWNDSPLPFQKKYFGGNELRAVLVKKRRGRWTDLSGRYKRASPWKMDHVVSHLNCKLWHAGDIFDEYSMVNVSSDYINNNNNDHRAIDHNNHVTYQLDLQVET